MERTFFDNVKIFALLYFLSIGVMYYLSYRSKGPLIIPGDIYSRKPGRTFYVPTGGALVVAVILYALFVNVLAKRFGA